MDVEHPDVLDPAVGDVQLRLVEREGEPVGPHEVVGDDAAGASDGVEAVDVTAADLALGTMTLVVAVDAVRRIGEPDRAVGSDDDVVGAVEPLALVPVGEHGDRTIVFGPRHPPVPVLAGHEPSLGVERVAVRVSRRVTELADGAGDLVPAQDAIVGNVADEEEPARRDVDRSLGPPAAELEPLDPIVAAAVPEPIVEDLELGRDGAGS